MLAGVSHRQGSLVELAAATTSESGTLAGPTDSDYSRNGSVVDDGIRDNVCPGDSAAMAATSASRTGVRAVRQPYAVGAQDRRRTTLEEVLRVTKDERAHLNGSLGGEKSKRSETVSLEDVAADPSEDDRNY